MKLISLTIAILVMTSACNAPQIVKEKRHIGSNIATVDCRSERVCTDDGTIEVTKPECWQLIIKQGMETTGICVSKDVWEKTQIGQEWTNETYPI